MYAIFTISGEREDTFVHQTGEAYNKAETNFRGQLQA